MYGRKIHGTETTLGVSGLLWRDALVLYDRKSGSYWSQIDGRAIAGPRSGEQLVEIPSRVTSWGEWKRSYPETQVLVPNRYSRSGTRYADYFVGSALGIFGTENSDRRLPGKAIVLGLLGAEATSAVPLGRVQERRIVEAMLGDDPVVIVPAGADDGAAFLRELQGRVLSFENHGDVTIRDRATGSIWDVRTGKATDGPLRGASMPRVRTRRAYWFVWTAFHPKTGLVED